MSEKITNYWITFQEKHPEYKEESVPTAAFFANDKEAANDIALLIKSRKKTATCSANISYLLEKEELPKAGSLLIVLDWDGNPVALIKTTKVSIRKFNEIDADWAKLEGEGNLSLEYWRKVHLEFFEAELEEYGLVPTEEMDLVCEEFVVVG